MGCEGALLKHMWTNKLSNIHSNLGFHEYFASLELKLDDMIPFLLIFTLVKKQCVQFLNCRALRSCDFSQADTYNPFRITYLYLKTVSNGYFVLLLRLKVL